MLRRDVCARSRPDAGAGYFSLYVALSGVAQHGQKLWPDRSANAPTGRAWPSSSAPIGPVTSTPVSSYPLSFYGSSSCSLARVSCFYRQTLFAPFFGATFIRAPLRHLQGSCSLLSSAVVHRCLSMAVYLASPPLRPAPSPSSDVHSPMNGPTASASAVSGVDGFSAGSVCSWLTRHPSWSPTRLALSSSRSRPLDPADSDSGARGHDTLAISRAAGLGFPASKLAHVHPPGQMFSCARPTRARRCRSSPNIE